MKAIHRAIAENLRESFAKRRLQFDATPVFEKLDRAFTNGCISESMEIINNLADALSNLDSSFDRELFSAIAYGKPCCGSPFTRHSPSPGSRGGELAVPWRTGSSPPGRTGRWVR